MKHSILLLVILLSGSTFLLGQETYENTLFLTESMVSPAADLSQIEWIEGHWRGEAFGGIVEEIWTPPHGGSMMCAFKLVRDNQVQFYELVTISEVNATLLLQLKHFHADLRGWEEKEETVDFKLVKVTENKVYFDGFTFERVDANEMNVYVVIEDRGKKIETRFNYHKVK